jgi:two-component system, cell cycle response regulator
LILVFLSSLVLAGLTFYRIRGNRRKLKDLARRASVDELTGALRREAFMENLDLAIRQARSSATPLCVAMLDVDDLKPVNDRHGHSAGDETLRNVVTAARSHLRGVDLVGRIGGDEFAVLLAGTTSVAATAIADTIRNEFARIASGETTVSIGVAEMLPNDLLESILERADERLYVAKQTKNIVVPAGR